MILFSTHQKLVAKNADVYRVDFDAVSYQGQVVVSSFSEHYATAQQAAKAISEHPGTIFTVKASSYNPLYVR